MQGLHDYLHYINQIVDFQSSKDLCYFEGKCPGNPSTPLGYFGDFDRAAAMAVDSYRRRDVAEQKRPWPDQAPCIFPSATLRSRKSRKT